MTITSTRHVSIPLASTDGKDPVWVAGPYKLEELPGKGKGLISIQDVTPGTCLLEEDPLFTTINITSLDTQERDLAKILKSLPKESQRAFLSLHNNKPGREPLSNIVRSNAYPLGPGSSVGGVFPTIARINHSCHPNAQQAWNSIKNQETIYAIRDIKVGEEITVSYSVGGTSSYRRDNLKQYFGFDCKCELCSLPPEQLRRSDAQMSEAQRLDDAIGNSRTVMMMPDRALSYCRALLKVFNEEDITDQRVARLYYDAFQICIMHADQARAKVFAERSRDARVLCEGQESPEALGLLDIVNNPSKHENFGATSRWKLGVSKIPKDLDAAKFEKWLWRMDV